MVVRVVFVSCFGLIVLSLVRVLWQPSVSGGAGLSGCSRGTLSSCRSTTILLYSVCPDQHHGCHFIRFLVLDFVFLVFLLFTCYVSLDMSHYQLCAMQSSLSKPCTIPGIIRDSSEWQNCSF